MRVFLLRYIVIDNKLLITYDWNIVVFLIRRSQMAVDVSRTQDVYKDAGQSVNFTTLLLNRKDRDAEL